MHCAAQAGHLSVVKLLVESGSPTTAETSNGRTPLWFAASENKLKVVTYLIQREHDSYKLLEDRKVLISHEKRLDGVYDHTYRFCPILPDYSKVNCLEIPIYLKRLIVIFDKEILLGHPDISENEKGFQ